MGANRETEHDMAHTSHADIAFLLAEAADEVEIGIAPYQSVIRGGRRRRARRWAVAAVTALVVSGSSATLAVAGLPGGDGDRVAPPAGRSHSATPEPYGARRTTLATGSDQGTQWSVVLDVWPAPRDAAQAQAQLDAMAEYGAIPDQTRHAYQLVRSSLYVVHRVVGDDESPVMWAAFPEGGAPPQDLETAAVPLEPGDDGPHRLVVGQVTKSVGQVTCTWTDGTRTVVDRPREDEDVPTGPEFIRHDTGSPVDWFVCLAPKGAEYASAEVTRHAD
ncbi:hypothetical protein [Streptomyces sp. JB150]|uniref:hypothetical protein n=1 Tax=Streptomyces sp. JB150 TaxID=2714844 RepID=UPI0014095B4E|nr:hypothetical protein [Streptomyces sp. JB150]QIJ62304.1 hypothetical protein G7Z13_09810 [Streptomyces sp. JB150]